MNFQRLDYHDYFADTTQILDEEQRAKSQLRGVNAKCPHIFQWLNNRILKERFRRQRINDLVHLYQQLFLHWASPIDPTVHCYIDQDGAKILIWIHLRNCAVTLRAITASMTARRDWPGLRLNNDRNLLMNVRPMAIGNVI